MSVQELIDKLQAVGDKTKEVYMRIGGLPIVNADNFEIDSYGDLILFEDNER